MERLTAEERSLNAGLAALEAKVGALTGSLRKRSVWCARSWPRRPACRRNTPSLPGVRRAPGTG
jgi:hypothetical protein